MYFFCLVAMAMTAVSSFFKLEFKRKTLPKKQIGQKKFQLNIRVHVKPLEFFFFQSTSVSSKHRLCSLDNRHSRCLCSFHSSAWLVHWCSTEDNEWYNQIYLSDNFCQLNLRIRLLNRVHAILCKPTSVKQHLPNNSNSSVSLLSDERKTAEYPKKIWTQ